MTQPPSKGLHKEEIRAKIRMRGWTMVGLSQKWGLSPHSVSHALCRPWASVEAKIAEFLKMKPEDIWPDRYDEDGKPLKSKCVMGKNNRNKPAHNDQFSEVA